jgi:hypothetical protein
MNQIENYYMKQAAGMPYFSGPMAQRGHGLGGIFGRLFRAAVPLFRRAAPVLKSAAKSVAKEAVRSGSNVLGDVIAGENIGDAFANRTSQGVNRLAKKGVAKIDRMMSTPKTIKRKKKRRHVDIFSK